MYMEFAVNFRNAARRIRSGMNFPSPTTYLHPPFQQKMRQATPNLSWMRLRVLRRDRYRCRGCGEDGDEITLGLQLIHPAASNAYEMLTLCARCENLARRCNITSNDGSGFLPQLWSQLEFARRTQSTTQSDGEEVESRRQCC
jgi:hypothetical protein